jgi:prepilin-type N-terminal cleavage/methylation domain-containing protein
VIESTSRRLLVKSGFTLAETMVSVAIVGTLSSIALPNYLNQVNRTRQNEAASTISQIQTTIATYADEFGLLPGSWADLNSINAVMTDTGPSQKESFEAIKLAGGYYEVAISQSANLFTITSTSTNAPKLNIIACINLTNGASAVNKGTNSDATETPNCG